MDFRRAAARHVAPIRDTRRPATPLCRLPGATRARHGVCFWNGEALRRASTRRGAMPTAKGPESFEFEKVSLDDARQVLDDAVKPAHAIARPAVQWEKQCKAPASA